MTDWIVDKHWFDESIPWLIPSNGNEFVSSDESTIDSFGDYIFSSIDRFAAPFSTSHFLNFYQYFNEPNSMNFVQEQKIKKTFQQEYRTLQCLGKGGFGQVYAGRRRSDNSPVVVKFLPRDRILNWGTFEGKRVPYEIEILWRLRGVSGVIKILDHFEETERFIFVMEQIPNSCTLFDFIMESPPLANTELLRHIFREVIRINVTLQMYGVWHRDCKPENILYCKNDRSLCFIDFGAAAPVQTEDFHEFQGTLEIMVPEWILQRRYNGEKACVWTIGICLYFLLYQQYPFRSKTDIVNNRSFLLYYESTDKEAYQTIRQCLNRNEHRRPKLNSLQHLPWLQSIV